MHGSVETRYRAIDRWSYAVLTTLSVLCGLITGVGKEWTGGNVQSNWLYGSAFIALQLFQALLKSLAYPVEAKVHDDLGKRWHTLLTKIELTIAVPPEDGEVNESSTGAKASNKVSVLSEISAGFNELSAASSGKIPQWAIDRFESRKGDMEGPELGSKKLSKTKTKAQMKLDAARLYQEELAKVQQEATRAAAGGAVDEPTGASALSPAHVNSGTGTIRDLEAGSSTSGGSAASSSGYGTPMGSRDREGAKSGATASLFGPGTGAMGGVSLATPGIQGPR